MLGAVSAVRFPGCPVQRCFRALPHSGGLVAPFCARLPGTQICRMAAREPNQRSLLDSRQTLRCTSDGGGCPQGCAHLGTGRSVGSQAPGRNTGSAGCEERPGAPTQGPGADPVSPGPEADPVLPGPTYSEGGEKPPQT